MSSHATRSEEFLSAFALGLLRRAGLKLAPVAERRYVSEIEQAVQQRLGIAAFERLGEVRVQAAAGELLNGEESKQTIEQLQQLLSNDDSFVQRELTQFAEEFLQTVRQNA